MEIYNITKNIKVACSSWRNGNRWGHEAILYKDGQELCKQRIRYYNRTWERFTFESTLHALVDKLDRYEDNILPLSERWRVAKFINNII